ncbi:hypothetical protein ACER0A_013545 [Haloimpatiens sp. FM7315]|uniref:hypothetical protein n=1 Tax=Haloimpatiens sp. FM7315 TaxID=3298609 RepID=UPI0039778F73
MKGFVLDKIKEEDAHINENEVISLEENLKEDMGFDGISIVNPENSNKIYIINSIYIQSENKKVIVALGENNNCSELDELFISKDVKKEENLIHINTVEKKIYDNTDILQGYYIILLPKGYVNIKVDEPVNELDIKLFCREEKIL